MSNGMTVTVATDIALPVAQYEMKHLKRLDGSPVVVQVEFIDQLTMTRIVGLPGGSPEVGEDLPPSVEDMERLVSYAKPLIERATCLFDHEGNEVRPAFWFNADAPRHVLSHPGRFVHLEDLAGLCFAILNVSGYSGGVAEQATFLHDGQGAEKGA